MAEAIELDLNTTDVSQLDPRVKRSLIEIQSRQDKKDESTVPEAYTVSSYYKDDTLGADVLKKKYLAHGKTIPGNYGNARLTLLPPWKGRKHFRINGKLNFLKH